MERKWIINENEVIFGNVDYHVELLGKYRTKEQTAGGGLWHWDKEKNIVYFFGSSMDFGSVTKEQFDVAWSNSLISPSIEDCHIVFSNKFNLHDVIQEHISSKSKTQ